MAEKLSNWELLEQALKEGRREANEKQHRENPDVTSTSMGQIIADMVEWDKNRSGSDGTEQHETRTKARAD